MRPVRAPFPINARDRAEALPADAEGAATVGLLRAIGVLAFPFLMGLTCQTQIWPWLAIPLRPFGVPLTLQTLWVLLAALSIGPRWGMLSMLGYLVVGAIGVPLFSEGSAGLATILGQTGGTSSGSSRASRSSRGSCGVPTGRSGGGAR